MNSWALGKFEAVDHEAEHDLPTQGIDLLVLPGVACRAGDLHTSKIEVHGLDCIELAAAIVRLLNATPGELS